MLVRPWYARSSQVLAALVAIAALGGIFRPATYAREAPSWAAQGIGQDWVNLLLVAPAIAVLSVVVARGSRGARLVLGGALLYVVYSFLLYAFAVHFNRCSSSTAPFWGSASTASRRSCSSSGPSRCGTGTAPTLPRRVAGTWLVVVAGAFAALWLSQVLAGAEGGSRPRREAPSWGSSSTRCTCSTSPSSAR